MNDVETLRVRSETESVRRLVLRSCALLQVFLVAAAQWVPVAHTVDDDPEPLVLTSLIGALALLDEESATSGTVAVTVLLVVVQVGLAASVVLGLLVAVLGSRPVGDGTSRWVIVALVTGMVLAGAALVGQFVVGALKLADGSGDEYRSAANEPAAAASIGLLVAVAAGVWLASLAQGVRRIHD